MHRLERPEEPEVLKQAEKEGIQDWELCPQDSKNAIRDTLLIMQNFRCAYCERQIQEDNKGHWDEHIEHFRRKDIKFHPELTFAWNNLFFSCMTRATCGTNKDKFIKSREQYALLIDPCKDNPEDFFGFNLSGEIFVRSNLSDADKKGQNSQLKRLVLIIRCLLSNEERK